MTQYRHLLFNEETCSAVRAADDCDYGGQVIDSYLKFIILPIFPPSSHPRVVCFFPVGLSLLIRHFQQVLRMLKFLLSPGLGS